MTESACQLLRLRKQKTIARTTGVGAETVVVKQFVKFNLASQFEAGFELRSQAYVMPSLNNYCTGPVDRNKLPSLAEFSLADPDFGRNDPIDLLIGGDLYGDILLPQQKKFDKGIFLQLTHFGWIVSGPTSEISYAHSVNINLCSLDTQLGAFCEKEELVESRNLTCEEIVCEDFFKKNYTHGFDGRYSVALPVRSQILGKSPPAVRHSDFSALNRLKQVENKFSEEQNFASKYRKSVDEYESFEHNVNIGPYPQCVKHSGYFLPHHGVARESSFDARSRLLPSSSLNDELFHGPALQDDLPAIINRWRRFKIGFSSDREKMFHQIPVVDSHQHHQQILWRNSDSDSCVDKRHTVTYGTSLAPYLSIDVLFQQAEDETYPEACKILRTDTTVDGIHSGADSTAIFIQKQLAQLLSAGGLKLRKWTSNSPEIMSHTPAVVHIKVLSGNGEGVINLLQYKTKIAPLKILSVPNLELCGAPLPVKLMNKVQQMLNLNISNVYYWTDRIAVLCWLRGESFRWRIFIEMDEVQRHPNISQWHYLSTHDNPANGASHGISSAELVQRSLW
ncbi:uncharacterized protein [Musca autumnalis]|uniref:uncharacterized protein n=1 Tax=Musca autumnalis TaxID=221902 RepID=UPI003CEBA8AD